METPIIDNIQQRVDESISAGVWARSCRRGEDEYIIFASDFTFDNTIKYLNGHGVSFKNLKGAYVMSNGDQVIEDSFIVNRTQYKNILPIIKHQESILVLSNVKYDDTRNAKLVYSKSGRETELGVFKPVDEHVAKQHECWTYDPYQDKYFVTGA